MAAAQIIQAVVGIVGSVIGAIGQAQDKKKQEAVSMLQQMQDKAQPLQSATIGGGQQQAQIMAPTASMADYAAGAAQQQSALSRVGGYLSSGGDIMKIVGQATGENRAAANAGMSAVSDKPLMTAGQPSDMNANPNPAGNDPTPSVSPAANDAVQAPEGVSYNGAEDYLKSLHSGFNFGGQNGQ
jgi:hypothetical protein